MLTCSWVGSIHGLDWVGFIYAHKELAQYKALKVPAKYSHPLLFWKENAVAYPLLSSVGTVARRILSISARSAQSDRDFMDHCTMYDDYGFDLA